MDFDEAVAIIITLEGGGRITERADDPGGLTKFGIALGEHPELSRDAIRRLTREQAVEIYRRSYWDPLSLDAVPAFLRLPIFDAAVNQGKRGCILLVQSSLVKMGRRISEDGIMGVKTLMALDSVSAMEFALEFLFQRIESYSKMEKFKIFGRGWIKRVLRIALAMKRK